MPPVESSVALASGVGGLRILSFYAALEEVGDQRADGEAEGAEQHQREAIPEEKATVRGEEPGSIGGLNLVHGVSSHPGCHRA